MKLNLNKIVDLCYNIFQLANFAKEVPEEYKLCLVKQIRKISKSMNNQLEKIDKK